MNFLNVTHYDSLSLYFKKKISYFEGTKTGCFFCKTTIFSHFKSNSSILSFFNFHLCCDFWEFWTYIHLKFLVTVKLNADPKFKVHFDRGPHFMELKWAKMREKSKKWIFWKYSVYKLILITDYYTYYKALYKPI